MDRRLGERAVRSGAERRGACAPSWAGSV